MSVQPNRRSFHVAELPNLPVQISITNVDETSRVIVGINNRDIRGKHAVPRDRCTTGPPSSPEFRPKGLSSTPKSISGSRLLPHPEEQEFWPAGSIEYDIDLINERTTYSEIIDLLVKHNCRDLSEQLRGLTQHPICSSVLMNVHQAYLLDGTRVAVKKVRAGDDYGTRDGSISKYQKRLARELHTWSQCAHRNIWPLMGLAAFQGQLAIVSLWADNGTLVQYLGKTPNANRCELVLGITTGLAYLHRNGIVHGDLKGPNILISVDGTPMLCDFGSSVIEGPTLLFADSRSGTDNTLRWAAPELLCGTIKSPNLATDVCSLGMTILETFTGKPPYSNLSNHSVLLSVVQKKKFPPRPEKEIPIESPYGNILWTLLRSCWSHNPNIRPTVRAVRYILTPMTEDSLRLALLPEPADDVEYDDDDKVDYSNQINEDDEEQDRIWLKKEKRAGKSRSGKEPSQTCSTLPSSSTGSHEQHARIEGSVRSLALDCKKKSLAAESRPRTRAPEPSQIPSKQASSPRESSHTQTVNKERSKEPKASRVVNGVLTAMPSCPDLANRYSSTVNDTNGLSRQRDAQSLAGTSHQDALRSRHNSAPTKAAEGNLGPKPQKVEKVPSLETSKDRRSQASELSVRRPDREGRTTPVPNSAPDRRPGFEDLHNVRHGAASPSDSQVNSHLAAGHCNQRRRPQENQVDIEILGSSEDDDDSSDDGDYTSEEGDHTPKDDDYSSEDGDYTPEEGSVSVRNLVSELGRNYRVKGRASL